MSMPTSTCRRTTSVTALEMTAAAACASFTSLRSRAKITSVTAWLRGRLPTWVVRIRSMLSPLSHSEFIGDINPVTARQGPPEEPARGELGIVNLVGQILRPGGHRPSFPLEAGPQVDQVDGIA